jgi:two-component system response regulator AtoC
MKAPAILIVDDEQEMCSSLEEIFRDEGFRASSTTKPETVLTRLSEDQIDLMLLDIRMPEVGGVDLLCKIKDLHPRLPVIMITGYPTVDTAVRAMRFGAVNYYTKPLNLGNLLAETKQLLTRESRGLESPPIAQGLVAEDPSMLPVKETILRAAEVDAPVLITGESGTGKELIAEAVHAASGRKEKPFIRVNCAAIPENLIESELFGHEAGAFTDAKKTRKGRFELANRGTLFLDEIGDMSLSTQARILHALQEKTFERVGGGESISTDARFIAATHQDLSTMIEGGEFREDLYYRLAVITIHVPPLRERGADIDLLVDYYFDFFAQKYNKPVSSVDPEVRAFFLRHDWPGNVRELRNCIERAVIFASDGHITFSHLPAQYEKIINTESHYTQESELLKINKEIIRDALNRSGGVKAKAADLLNISRKTLYNRMKRLGMEQ